MNRSSSSLTVAGMATLAVALALALAACGGGGGGKKATAVPTEEATATQVSAVPTATEAAATTTPEATSGATTLKVELKEFSITGEGGAALASVPAGDVTVDAKNVGAIAHSLTIIKTDTDPAQLPLNGTVVDVAAAGEVAGELAQFDAGATATGTFKLQPGKYAVICNIPSHYQARMYAQLTVD